MHTKWQKWCYVSPGLGLKRPGSFWFCSFGIQPHFRKLRQHDWVTRNQTKRVRSRKALALPAVSAEMSERRLKPSWVLQPQLNFPWNAGVSRGYSIEQQSCLAANSITGKNNHCFKSVSCVGWVVLLSIGIWKKKEDMTLLVAKPIAIHSFL